MTSRLHIAALLALAAGCGNYSNEDLEFMNALPQRDQLQANIPPSALTIADEAELAHTTHDVTATFNGTVSNVVALVDAIRSLQPTTRAPNERVWGPYNADKHPGWLARMVVTRDPVDLQQFSYEIDFHPIGGADTDWTALLSGSFHTSGIPHRGTGQFAFVTAVLRAKGFDPMLDMVDHMEFSYETASDPVHIHGAVTNLPDPTTTDPPTAAEYDYKETAEGQGQMTFDLFGNFVPGPATEQVNVTSQWLGSGRGRSVFQIVSGDGAGSTHTECWDDSFRATFNDKPWSPAEDLGDPSACPQITLL